MNLIFNIERNETISGAGAVGRIKNPQGTFIILAEPEPYHDAALFRWVQLRRLQLQSL
jgi:hypothetical protein